ncbi:MAG: acyltransferase [Methanosphaera sp.]|nr:acyltransferase [Methanosphaera sp.]
MERIVYADYLRIIGIIGVIGVHLSGDYLSKTTLFSSLWYHGVVFSSITRSGVLLFIMVSGLLLLDRPQSLENIPHRIKRVMVPFIFWIFIILLKMILIDHYFVVNSLPEFLNLFICSLLDPFIISEEFWYIYMIIGFYLMLPILYKWIKNATEKEIEYFLIVWFAVLVLNYAGIHFMLLSYLNLFVGHIGFFLLGFYLSKNDSKYFNSVTFGLILFVIGTFMTFFSIYIPCLVSQQLDLSYIVLQNLSPFFVLKAMGMFLICKNLDYEKLFGNYVNSVNNYAMKFAEMTYGLYLIHILVPIRLIFNINISPFINVPILTLIIIVVVSALLLLMNKIPVLHYFTGMKKA